MDEPTAPEIRRRPGGRSAAVRTAVQRATVELLDEGGYERLEIPEVAERAGVHRTTIYRRWPTKVHLVVDTMAALASAEVPVPDTGSVQDDLVAYLLDTVDVLRTGVVRALIAAFVEVDDPDLVEARARFWATRFEGSAAMVERAIERGELAPGTDAHGVLEAAAGPIYFRLFVSGEPVDRADVERFVRRSLGWT